ncbi:MAG: Holliday junction branch migration protein RuvA [Pyrinomonadaceae bacterium]
MISYLSGKLIEKEANTAIVDVGGVGYEATIPLSTFYELGEIDSEVSLRIYTYVREDALQLYGFKTNRERALFLKLITISGIGPKLAITMLSGMSADEIVGAITTDNIAHLSSIPGIGKKTAERLVIELRDKLDAVGIVDLSAAVSNSGAESLSGNEVYEDALSALINLGYQQKAAEQALKSAADEGTEMSVQKLLRRSLQLLAKN